MGRKKPKSILPRSEFQMTLSGFEVLEKVPDKGGNSGRVYVPKSWIGKKVKLILVEE